MVEPATTGGDHGGGEEEFLLREISNGEHSWRLNFDGFQVSSQHIEKPPRGLQDCLGVLGIFRNLDKLIISINRKSIMNIFFQSQLNITREIYV